MHQESPFVVHFVCDMHQESPFVVHFVCDMHQESPFVVHFVCDMHQESPFLVHFVCDMHQESPFLGHIHCWRVGGGGAMRRQMTPKGYKQTDIGIIPEDWDVYNFSDKFNISVGGDFDGGMSSKLKSESYPYPIYSNGVDNYGLYGFCSYAPYNKDSITITARGTLGVATWRKEPFSAIGRVLILEKKEQDIDCNFVATYTNCKINFVTETTGVPQLTAPQVAKYEFAYPPLEEQRAIAGVLSDVDGLIESIERLIGKKRDMKTAAMQQLLTGKTRLPAFAKTTKTKITDIGKIPEDWDVVELGELADFIRGQGLSKTKLSENGKFGCILYGELFTHYHEVIGKIHSHTDCNEGVRSRDTDVLFPGSTTTKGIDLAVASAILENDILLGGDINILRQKNPLYDSIFLAYYLTQVKKQEIEKRTQGITIIHLYGKSLHDLKISLPPLDEQRAIAAVLSDMDSEIESLERRLAKTRALKMGIMQQLLTGKIRLVKPQPKH